MQIDAFEDPPPVQSEGPQGRGGQGDRSGEGAGKRGKLAKGYAASWDALVEVKGAVERDG